jgi:hypothetical protein
MSSEIATASRPLPQGCPPRLQPEVKQGFSLGPCHYPHQELQLFRRRFPQSFGPFASRGGLYPQLGRITIRCHKAYTELIYNHTSSPRLSKALRKWDEERWDAVEQRQKLAWVLLVELLSFQFVSSVC